MGLMRKNFTQETAFRVPSGTKHHHSIVFGHNGSLWHRGYNMTYSPKSLLCKISTKMRSELLHSFQ